MADEVTTTEKVVETKKEETKKEETVAVLPKGKLSEKATRGTLDKR